MEIKWKDLIKAGKFSNKIRFTDDLTTHNEGGEFEKVFHEIYPPELELKRKKQIARNQFWILI